MLQNLIQSINKNRAARSNALVGFGQRPYFNDRTRAVEVTDNLNDKFKLTDAQADLYQHVTEDWQHLYDVVIKSGRPDPVKCGFGLPTAKSLQAKKLCVLDLERNVFIIRLAKPDDKPCDFNPIDNKIIAKKQQISNFINNPKNRNWIVNFLRDLPNKKATLDQIIRFRYGDLHNADDRYQIERKIKSLAREGVLNYRISYSGNVASLKK